MSEATDLEDIIAAAQEDYADDHLAFLLAETRHRLNLPPDTPDRELFARLAADDAFERLLGQAPSGQPGRSAYTAQLDRLRTRRAFAAAAAAVQVHTHAVSRGVPPELAERLAGVALAQLAATDAADDTRRPGAWSWRRWRSTRTLDRWGYVLGVHAGGGWQVDLTGSWDTLRWRSFRWTRRPYVLGWPIDKWRCLLRYHHLPYWPAGSPVFAGMCGRCIPWPCCNSIEQGHTDGCAEEEQREQA